MGHGLHLRDTVPSFISTLLFEQGSIFHRVYNLNLTKVLVVKISIATIIGLIRPLVVLSTRIAGTSIKFHVALAPLHLLKRSGRLQSK